VATKRFSIFSEGDVYFHIGDGTAQYEGTEVAETFQEACAKHYAKSREPHFYEAKTNTYWGCRLFETLDEAQRSFG